MSLETFRLETRNWLADNCPPGARGPGEISNGSTKIDIKDSENHNYQINKNFYNSESYNDLTTVNNNEYDYVIIELPNIIEVNYPIKLVMNSDITILVCRSNRLWTKADNNLLNNTINDYKKKFENSEFNMEKIKLCYWSNLINSYK